LPASALVFFLLLPAAQAGQNLAQLLTSSPWCSFTYNKTTGYSHTKRYVGASEPDEHPPRCKEIKIIIVQRAYFSPRQWALSKSSKKTLDDVVAILRTNTDLPKIEVRGFADFRELPDHEIGLSLKRAEKVFQYLVKNRVEPERLVLRAMGSEKAPKSKGREDERGSGNRLVEFVVMYEPKSPAKPLSPQELQKLEEKMKKEPQHFKERIPLC
jgi:outer membrane protein OmpA-like peptidoglycan-associated protein